MPKVSLSDLASLQNETSAISTINVNNAAIEEGFNNTISRDGSSPNTLEAEINMNHYRLYNVPLVPMSNADVATKYYVDYLAGQIADATPTNPNDAIIDGDLTVTGTITGTVAGYIQNVVEDTTPQLGGNLDLNGNVITGLEIGTDVQAQSDVLDDLDTLGTVSSDGQMIVGTGAGIFTYESGGTLRTSIGVGSTDTPEFAGLTIGSSNGIDINPGSDVDTDLVTVGVTGSPTFSWDESSDGFKLTKPLIVSSDGEGDLTHTIAGTSVTSDLEIHSEGSSDLGGIAIHRHTNNNNFGGHLLFLRSDGDHATPTAVDDNDTLGRLIGLGYDGTDYEMAGEIRFVVDGTPGSNDMPGEIQFFTNAGSQTLTLNAALRADGTFEDGSGNEFYKVTGTDVAVTDGGTGASTASGARTNLGLAIGSDVQAFDADTLKADVADELTAGFSHAVYNAGTQSSGTFTPDEANGNMQRAVNGGAHTLAPPSEDCTIIIQYTNNASASTITTSGFSGVFGDGFTTNDGDDFICTIIKINGFSSLTIQDVS